MRSFYSCFSIFFLALFCGAANARSNDTVHKEPVGVWVEVAPLPALVPERDNEHQGGLAYLLRDEQIVQRESGYDWYWRSAYKIIARPGLDEGANITFDFDPTRQRVSLNHIRVQRDGQWHDRLQDAQTHLYRRETGAEAGILDGWLTTRVHLTDVRVGDIIDYGLTFTVRPIVAQNLFHFRFSPRWGVPISLQRARITWDSEAPLHVRRERTEEVPAIVTQDGRTVYTWTVWDPDPVKIEANRPAGHPALPSIEVSSVSRWVDVVEAVLPYYQSVATDLPQPFAGRLEQIAAASGDPAVRMIEAMRLIQDDIRYVSIAVGAGSYVPRPPDEVVRSGFGDCKDKSLLLVLALQRLGIEAYVALSDIDDGHALDRVLPSLRAFDHAIVKAVIDGRVYWMDPTSYLQGGTAANLVQPDYGYALVLAPGMDALDKLPADPAESPTVLTEESFWLPLEEGEPLTLHVKTVYQGADANSQRSRIASQSLSALGDDYLRYYDSHYPGIRATEALLVRDDRDWNSLEIEETYALDWDALMGEGLAKKFPLRADLQLGLPKVAAGPRSASIPIGKPRYTRHVVWVSNLKGEYTGPSADVLKPYFLLKLYSAYADGVLKIDWHFRTLMREVPATALPHYRLAVDAVSKGTYWTYDFTYYDGD